MKKKKIVLICVLSAVALVILAAAGVCLYILSDVNGYFTNDTELSFVVNRGDNSYAISQNLAEQGVIKYPRLFRLVAKHMDADGKYTYGEYNIVKGAGYKTIIEKLLLKPDNDFMIKLTIPEGYTSKQILNLIDEKFEGITSEDIEGLKNDIYEVEGRPQRDDKYEGYLLPNTYFFYEDATLDYIIETLLKAFEDFAKENNLYKRANEKGLTLDEAVTLGSVIYAESGRSEDMKLISSVFHNRLSIGMKLQSDVTVLYALGVRKPIVTIADTKTESPYNTYYVKGLPVGPICCPNLDAIVAAIEPSESEYMYFCADKDGNVIYSVTYAEHIKAARG